MSINIFWRAILLLLFVFASVCSIHAQSDFRRGFVVLQSEDTIKGYVNFNNPWKCEFKVDLKAQAQEYSPQQVKAYGFLKSRHFVSATLPDSKEAKILEVLQKGRISLYANKDRSTFLAVKDSVYILQKGEERKVTIEGTDYIKQGTSYIGILNYLFMDCGLQDFSKLRYAEASINRVVEAYNKCAGGTLFIPKKQIPPILIHPGLFAGMNMSKPIMPSLANNSFDPSRSAVYGVSLQINAPRLSEKFAVIANGMLVSAVYQQESKSAGVVRDLTIKTFSAKFPIGIKYTVSSRSESPYIKVGYSRSLRIDTKSRIITEAMFPSGDVYTSLEEQSLPSESDNGLWMAVGYERTIFSRINIFAEVQTDRFVGARLLQGPATSSISSFSIVTGLSF